MINIPAVILSKINDLPDTLFQLVHKQFKRSVFIHSVPEILYEIESGHITEDAIYFVDVDMIPVLLMHMEKPYFLVALAEDGEQIIHNDVIRDYLYIRYPNSTGQLQRILKNLDMIIERRSFSKEIERLHQVGSRISSEKEVNKLIDVILEVSMNLIGAEAGSFYTVVDSRTNQWSAYKNKNPYKMLQFEIAKNRRIPLSIESMILPVLPTTIVGSSIIMEKAIRIDDVHAIPETQPYTYDAQVEKRTGYVCKSMLTLPMKDKVGRVLGAIQLINKYSNDTLVPFNKRDEHMMEFLSNYAAIALENSHVYKEMNELLADYEKIVQAIDLQNSSHGDELHKLKDSIEMNPSALIITDAEGTILYANKQFEDLTGYAPHELTGKRPSILKSGKMQPGFYKKLWDTILTGQTWHGEIYNKKKNGDLYWEKSSISSITSPEGQIKYFVNTREDISALKASNSQLMKALTDLKIAQSALIQNEKNAAIGQLAAGMAHEINNPLGFITSNVDTLGDYSKLLIESVNTLKTLASIGPDSTFNQSSVDMIKDDLDDLLSETYDGLNRVKKLVEAMRAYANIDTLSKADVFNISQPLENTVTVFKSLIKDQCAFTVSPYDDLSITGDANKLQQVLMNILINALDAVKRNGKENEDGNRDGEITINLRTNKMNVYIDVIDTGSGISPDIQSKIFDPFFTTKSIGDGPGLGLSQALSIIKTEFNGDIQFETNKTGTTFIVWIPIK